MMNKYIKLLIIALIGFTSGCQEPDEIISTANSNGLISVTAYFVDNNTDAEFVTSVTDLSSEIVIEVPYYYPKASNDQVSISKMRVIASIDDNCTITPELGILDLTQKNYFIFTNGSGESMRICITGEAKKISDCSVTYFSVLEDESTGRSAVTGTIDESNHTISLVTTEDLSSVNVEYVISPHATIFPDLTSAIDLNGDVELTVTAQDGSTKVYTVSKAAPDKINYGYRVSSEEELWSFDFTGYGLLWETSNNASLAAIGNQLVVCMGNGTTPVYFNRITGTHLGEITLGEADANGCVVNDLNNNLLICNNALDGNTFNIYSTTSVSKNPSLLLSYPNTTGFSLGRKVSVQGSVNDNAIISASFNGSGSNGFVRWIVSGGVVGSPETVTTSDIGTWGDDDITTADVVYVTKDVSDGYFTSFYDEDILYYMKGSTASANLDPQSDGNGWAYNNNCLDVKEFNEARYLALCCISHFPQWGLPTQLYLYDVTSTALFTGTIDASNALVFNPGITSFNDLDGISATGDVLLVPSSDGYTLNLYYIDNNCKVLGAYQFDCIDK